MSSGWWVFIIIVSISLTIVGLALEKDIKYQNEKERFCEEKGGIMLNDGSGCIFEGADENVLYKIVKKADGRFVLVK